MIYAVDFDRTLSYAPYPDVGLANGKLIEFLVSARKRGDKVILWTSREGTPLDDALTFCKANGLEFDAVNDNLPEMTERYGNNCRKINADIYIDDKACQVDDFIARHCTASTGIRSIRTRGRRKV